MGSYRIGFYKKATANIDDTIVLIQNLLQKANLDTEMSGEAIKCFQVCYRLKRRLETAQTAPQFRLQTVCN